MLNFQPSGLELQNQTVTRQTVPLLAMLANDGARDDSDQKVVLTLT